MLRVNPWKKECWRHWAAVGLFEGSNWNILFIKSIASEEAFGIRELRDVETNFGNEKLILLASL